MNKKNYNIKANSLFVISKYNLAQSEENLYSYNRTIKAYVPVNLGSLEHMVDEAFPEHTEWQIRKICKFIIPEMKAADYQKVFSARYIRFNNCIYDLKTGTTTKPSDTIPEEVYQYVPCNYDENIKSAMMDKALNEWSCNDPAVRQILLELTGYIMTGHPIMRKMFSLVGPKRSGKSTFIKVIQGMLTSERVSCVLPETLKERFGLSQLPNKLVNISPDLPNVRISSQSLSIIRSIVSYESVYVEEKNVASYKCRLPLVLLWGCNSLPEMPDSFGAMKDRIIPLFFNAKFVAGENDIPDFETLLLKDTDAMTYLASEAIKAFKNVLDTGKFTIPESSQEILSEFEYSNNPEIEFLDSHERSYFIDQSTDVIYDEYCNFCENETDHQPVSKHTLKSTISSHLGLKDKRVAMNGHKIRIYKEM